MSLRLRASLCAACTRRRDYGISDLAIDASSSQRFAPHRAGPTRSEGSDHRPPGEGEDVELEDKPSRQTPRRYKVIFHNDDYTTMEFVVDVLERFFHKTETEARHIMLTVHNKGSAVAGVYTRDVAETKAQQVMDARARERNAAAAHDGARVARTKGSRTAMRISPEVEIALSLAAERGGAAASRVLHARAPALCAALRRGDGADRPPRRRRSGRRSRRSSSSSSPTSSRASRKRPTTSPAASLGVQRAIRRAAAHVQSSGKEQVTGANVLVAIFAERDSPAVSLLEKAGVTRLDVVAYISHGVSKIGRGATTGREKEPASLDGEGEGAALAARPAEGVHDQPQRGGAGEADRSARRPLERGRRG